MRLVLPLALLLIAAPASAQWERLDGGLPVDALREVTEVAGDETHVYVTVVSGQSTTGRVHILRSADDGETWTEVFAGYDGSTAATGLRKSGGWWVLVVRDGGPAAVLSSINGLDWAETPSRLPFDTGAIGARSGTSYVVVGDGPSYRSDDAGATWAPFGESRPMATVVLGRGSFYGLSQIGQAYRLRGTTWDGPATFKTPETLASLVAHGSRLWAKAEGGPLYTSFDGLVYEPRATAREDDWDTVVTTELRLVPWVLPGPRHVFLSTDDGATVADVTAGHPAETDGAPCPATYGVRTTAVFAVVTCATGAPGRDGLYRYRLGATAAASGPAADGLALAVAGNPTAGGARVRLTLAEAEAVRVDVVDVRGRRVATLADGPQRAGTTALAVPAGLAPGLYVVRAAAADGRAVRATLTVAR